MRQPSSPSGQEITGLSREEGGRGAKPHGNPLTEKELDLEERKGSLRVSPIWGQSRKRPVRS